MAEYLHPCRYCDTLVPANAEYCPACKRKNPVGPLRCPRCQNPIKRSHGICSNCGLPLQIICPACHEQTFLADYCDNCQEALLILCPNPKCKKLQAPIGDTCIYCGKPLK